MQGVCSITGYRTASAEGKSSCTCHSLTSFSSGLAWMWVLAMQMSCFLAALSDCGPSKASRTAIRATLSCSHKANHTRQITQGKSHRVCPQPQVMVPCRCSRDKIRHRGAHPHKCTGNYKADSSAKQESTNQSSLSRAPCSESVSHMLTAYLLSSCCTASD